MPDSPVRTGDFFCQYATYNNSNTMLKQSKTPKTRKKQAQPKQLIGKDFKSHPEHINRKGRPKRFDELRDMTVEMGNEIVPVEVGKGKTKKIILMTRFERILLNWFESLSFDKQQAVMQYGFGKIPDKLEIKSGDAIEHFVLPATCMGPSFMGVYRDLRNHLHTEYVLKGGRGSLKSSFASLVIVELIINNPTFHALITRQVKDTLRTSVYAQMVWAIDLLGMNDRFKCTTSPLEIEYIPTGQKIYFRGADDPGKMKSIKPPFGYIAILWFEELDQFHGPESVRKIEQSVIRGGDEAYIIKSFNPPRTTGNWVNKYVQIPKENQYIHTSDYLSVPKDWLGQPFIDEAEHLQEVNPDAYEHEYLGVANGSGGQVFENVKIRAITDEEISQFERVLNGNDWGYYPDPFAYVKCHYDAARLKLYIFGEVKCQKKSNKKAYEAIVKYGYRPQDLLIADSAEPKSVADFKEYGANIRGAEKGPDSVTYSIKWLQGLVEIIIDPVRCPESTQEFLDYELEQDKDENYISEYPDKNNHFIDATRYATNLIWRVRGQ